MIQWFCLLFGNQFTPDVVLDGYSVDRLMHDIALALIAEHTQTTEILNAFLTKAAQTKRQTSPRVCRCPNSFTPPITCCWKAAGAWTRSTEWTCWLSQASRLEYAERESKKNLAEPSSTRFGAIGNH